MMQRTIGAAVLCAAMVSAPSTWAREITVEVTNLTNGLSFTPLLVAAHRADAGLFSLGSEASANLQAMAEGGEISGLIGDVEATGGVVVADPAEGVLGPGDSATATFHPRGRYQRRLSVVAMLLPTNDGFLGLNSVRIPHRQGTYTFFVRGYDAGTEANDEVVNGGGAPGAPGIPADPADNAGSGGTGVAGPDVNSTVHVHRGTLGDDDPQGGASDLDRSVHRWLNPVARVVVTVGHH